MSAREPVVEAGDGACYIDTASLAKIFKLLGSRRSIRRYSSEPVDSKVVRQLLEAAAMAPSAHNRQPWRFIVVSSEAQKAKLAGAMGERLRADRLKDNDPIDVIEADVVRSFARITGSPTLILVCLTTADLDVYGDAKRGDAEYLMAVQSTAMAVQNLLIAAHAAGLGACWMCAPLFCPDVMRSAMSLPQAWQPQAIVTLGYPASAGKPFSRRPLAEVVRIVGDPA